MRKLRPREAPPSTSPSLEDLEGRAAALSGDVCGGWTWARQRREAAVTRERSRFWLRARMGPPPALPGQYRMEAQALERHQMLQVPS